MRSPPPVCLSWFATAPDAATRVWWAVQAGLYALTGAAVAAWAAYIAWDVWAPVGLIPAWDAHRVAGAAAIICAACGGAWGWWLAQVQARRQGELQLAWTGEFWQFQGVQVPAPRVMLDLGPWMLLLIGGQWVSLSKGLAQESWQPLRAAIYSRAHSLPNP